MQRMIRYCGLTKRSKMDDMSGLVLVVQSLQTCACRAASAACVRAPGPPDVTFVLGREAAAGGRERGAGAGAGAGTYHLDATLTMRTTLPLRLGYVANCEGDGIVARGIDLRFVGS